MSFKRSDAIVAVFLYVAACAVVVWAILDGQLGRNQTDGVAILAAGMVGSAAIVGLVVLRGTRVSVPSPWRHQGNRPEVEDMSPLRPQEHAIRAAWAAARDRGSLAEELDARGITLASVTASEAGGRERRGAGSVARGLLEGEIVAVDGLGDVHRLDQRRTGDLRPEIEARLAGVERSALSGVADAVCAQKRKLDEAREAAEARRAAAARRAADEKCRRQREEEERCRAEEGRRRQIRVAAESLARKEARRLAMSMAPSLAELRGMDPQRFEDKIAQLFRQLGYRVEQTPYSNDGGRDAVMWRTGEKFLLECKRYGASGSSGRPELQKFHSAIITDGAKKGFFVSAGKFTKGAVNFAATVPVEIIDGSRLVQLMRNCCPNASSGDDSYASMCRECGDEVRHQLRAPKAARCRLGHLVELTLNINKVRRAAL